MPWLQEFSKGARVLITEGWRLECGAYALYSLYYIGVI